MSNKITTFLERIWNNIYIRRFRTYTKEFLYIWILLIVLLVLAHLAPSHWCEVLFYSRIILICLTILILVLPMNAVYGLMGTSGNIRLFFFNFLFITLLFAGIYYWGFFQDAGISYDVNQPHIDYQMFVDCDKKDSVKIETTRDTIYLEHIIDSVTTKEAIVHINTEELHYQEIGFWEVWRCTILTTLTQEPTDLLSNATTYNAAMNGPNAHIDQQKANLLHWILILHIIIAWIFFGVFISLLYNKFRYES